MCQFSENESLFVIKYKYNKKIMRVNKLNKKLNKHEIKCNFFSLSMLK